MAEQTFRRRSTSRATRVIDVQRLGTPELLALHERWFGPLDARSKRRIVDGAAARGWDRPWDMDSLAA